MVRYNEWGDETKACRVATNPAGYRVYCTYTRPTVIATVTITLIFFLPRMLIN